MGKVFIKHFEEVGIEDIPEVGGKNASLGEMIQNLSSKGVNIPGGYVVTASAYRYFLKKSGLLEFLKKELKEINVDNLSDLSKSAKAIRDKIEKTNFPKDLKEKIIAAHKIAEKKFGKKTSFAVRSSATAEDLPDASFAGEHETYLNVRGVDKILVAVKSTMASLFTDRAISYRVDKGFDHLKIALSVGVQKMVRSDLGSSGVMFTLDTETGFPHVILISGSWGLGEMIVQGEVTPDEFLVFKNLLGDKNFVPIIDKRLGVKNQKMIYGEKTPTKIIGTNKKERESFILTDEEVLKLALWGVEVEKHYSQKHHQWTPMDLEWAKDGTDNKLYLIQARPETVHAGRDFSQILEYRLLEKGEEIIRGTSVGRKIAQGRASVILSPAKINQFKKGEILITEMTDPDWEPIMKEASAIVTDCGGRTSHAAIVARELGIPAVVGTIFATEKIKTGEKITVDTTSSEGVIYEGLLKFETLEHNIKKLPKVKVKIMLNIATPDTAFEKSFLPNEGVGLAREEFIIASNIGIHPLACLNYPSLPKGIKNEIDRRTFGYPDKEKFYIDKLSFGIGKIGAAFYPKKVIVRFSDFKTNEYRSLIGGELFEPEEENPMIGFRGASRYYHPFFAPAFILEIKALKKVREEMGLSNVCLMIPFCRTIEEGKKVIKIMEENGLKRDLSSNSGLKVYMMCEIPSNVILAPDFLEIFDGMSIGSNDLTQLALGLDRDGNEKIRGIGNEENLAVKKLISEVIKKCKERGRYIGICGQAPSDYPSFAKFLVEEGIESISLNPDSVIKTIIEIDKQENS